MRLENASIQDRHTLVEFFKKNQSEIFAKHRRDQKNSWASDHDIIQAINDTLNISIEHLEDGGDIKISKGINWFMKISRWQLIEIHRERFGRKGFKPKPKHHLFEPRSSIFEETPDGAADPLDGLIRTELVGRIKNVLKPFVSEGRKWAKAAWLAYVEGKNQSESAEILGVATGTIGTLLLVARTKLLDLLPDLEEYWKE